MRPAHTENVEGRGRIGNLARRLHGIGPLLGLVALCIGGTLLNPDFATFDNAMNVLTRTSFIGIIAVGMTFVIISGGIDLSVGSMAALIAGSMIWMMNGLAHGVGGHSFAPLTIIALGIVLAWFWEVFSVSRTDSRDQGAHRAVYRDPRHTRHLSSGPDMVGGRWCADA